MSEALGESDGAPKPDLATLYGAWANGGIGICVTGNVMIDHRALGEPGNVIIEDETHLNALQKWAQAATQNNTQCWVQLNHPGKQAPKGLNKETVSPSAIPFRKDMQAFFPTPRELTSTEINDLIQRFATAAAICVSITFGMKDILTASRTSLPARSIAAARSKVNPRFALSAEISALITLTTFPPARKCASSFGRSTVNPALVAVIMLRTIITGGTFRNRIPTRSLNIFNFTPEKNAVI